MLTCDGSDVKAPEDASLEDGHQEDQRSGDQNRCGGDLPPREFVEPREERDGYRNRTGSVRSREREGEEELVPAIDEDEDARRDHAWAGQGQEDFEEDLRG